MSGNKMVASILEKNDTVNLVFVVITEYVTRSW